MSIWNKNYILSFFLSTGLYYPSPVNFSYFWNFGSLALFFLISQMLTGVFLAMHYMPNMDLAFYSVEHITLDVNYGWFIRYLHSNGASMFFLVVYMHLLSGLYYNSFTYPSQLLWVSGVILLFLMIVIAFLGYVLPWGQMSFWAATVMTNLVSAIPYFGNDILMWIWGGFSVGNATLNSFFSLHFVLPFVLLFISLVHLLFLHEFGSNNPIGISSKSDDIYMNPYYTVKDLYGVILFFILFFYFVFFNPNYLGHSDNYILANPMVTPTHMVPEWYLLPFYAILSSVPNKLLGVLMLLFAMLMLMLLPFYLNVIYRVVKYRIYLSFVFWIFFFNCLVLGWIGGKTVEPPYYFIGQVSTVFYFLYFLFILPLICFIEFNHYNFYFFNNVSINGDLIVKKNNFFNSLNSFFLFFVNIFFKMTLLYESFMIIFLNFFFFLENSLKKKDFFFNLKSFIEKFLLDMLFVILNSNMLFFSFYVKQNFILLLDKNNNDKILNFIYIGGEFLGNLCKFDILKNDIFVFNYIKLTWNVDYMKGVFNSWCYLI